MTSPAEEPQQELVDLNGCFRDDPHFQRSLEVSEASIARLEQSLVLMHKITSAQFDHSREVAGRNTQFADELVRLAQQFRAANTTQTEAAQDEIIMSSLSKCSGVLKEIEQSRRTLHMHLNEVLMEPLDRLVRGDLSTLKKLCKDSAGAAGTYENALYKYLSERPNDPNTAQHAEDAAKARIAYHRRYLAYCQKLNDVQRRKRFEVVETFVAMMLAQFSFFHQGYEQLKDLEPSLRNLSLYLTELRSEYQSAAPVPLDSYLAAVPAAAYNPRTPSGEISVVGAPVAGAGRPSGSADPSAATHAALVKVHKADYLWKKSSQRLRNVWHRRYFELLGSTLIYYSKDKEDEDPRTQVDLRVCMVRDAPVPERRFCFELVSPARTLTLQALNEAEKVSWIGAIQQAISNALYVGQPASSAVGATVASPRAAASQQPSVASLSAAGAAIAAKPVNAAETVKEAAAQIGAPMFIEQEEAIRRIRAVAGNDTCADCLAPNPEWASCNLGVMVCLACSGVHRGLGRHVSKVRSLTLDRWERDVVVVMERLGNSRVNEIFEAKLRAHDDADNVRPGHSASRGDQERWIQAKYVAKEFVWDEANVQAFLAQSVGAALFQAIDSQDVLALLKCIALGADLNEPRDAQSQHLPLQVAIDRRRLLAVEYLLQWQPSLTLVDATGATCLHHAVRANLPNVVGALLRRDSGALRVYDENVQTPLDLAMSLAAQDAAYQPVADLLTQFAAANPALARSTVPEVRSAVSPATVSPAAVSPAAVSPAATAIRTTGAALEALHVSSAALVETASAAVDNSEMAAFEAAPASEVSDAGAQPRDASASEPFGAPVSLSNPWSASPQPSTRALDGMGAQCGGSDDFGDFSSGGGF